MHKEHSFLANVDKNENVFYLYNAILNEQLPMHSHSKHQMCYIKGGVAFLNTTDKSYFIPARHFLWIPAGIAHNITSRSAVTMAYNIFFPTSLFKQNSSVGTQEGIYPVNNLLMEMITYIKNWNGEISTKETTKFEFLNAMKNIVLEVSKTPLPIVLPTTDDEKLREILRYIHNHISEPLTLNEVSEVYNYGSRTLSRLFQNKIKTSFLQYIKLTRIIKSMELLLKSDMPVTEIAYNCGYNSLSSFSYTFKQIVKQTPVEFRKLNKSTSSTPTLYHSFE